jgi:cell division protein FtsB
MKSVLLKIKSSIEHVIPMTITSLALFCFVVYLLVVVSKSVVANYNSNKDIDKEGSKMALMAEQNIQLQNAINYYKTNSFKEKEARQKLGYKASGESVLSLPIDTQEEKLADTGLAQASIRQPNYSLWWQYFFEDKE